MQIKVRINNIGSVSLPISYHHIEQSAIYALIRGDLHDNGVSYEKRDYKLFTFGPFEGKYTIRNKMITFYDNIKFEFRCHDVEVAEAFIENLNKNGFRLGDISYHNVAIEKNDFQVSGERIKLRMKSPICVYETDEDKHTCFFNPGDEQFYQYVLDNFKRKYTAQAGLEPPEEIVFSLASYNERDKYLTKYKGFFIEAWKGTYYLEGPAEYITFMYNTGLGSKNSQGFGMFDII